MKTAVEAWLVEAVRLLPAEAMARTWKNSGGGYSACVDCGAEAYVSDATGAACGATATAAAEDIKEWLLDDLSQGGRKGKRQYQPHWNEYDVRYRLGKLWVAKAAGFRLVERGRQSVLKGRWRFEINAEVGAEVVGHGAAVEAAFDRLLMQGGDLMSAELARVVRALGFRAWGGVGP